METTAFFWILRHFGWRLALALAVGLTALTPARAETSAAFLKNNMDVRSEAMGGGADAFVTGAAAAFRNPAGAARLANDELMFSYTQAMLGSSYQGISFMRAPQERETARYKVSASGVRTENLSERGRTSVGVHAIYHQLGTFETTDASFNVTGSVRPYNIAAGLTLARPLGAVSAGLTLKAVHQSLGTASSNSYAADLGIVAPLPARGLSLSASVTNVGTKVRFEQEEFDLPAAANIGLGYQSRFFRVSADVRSPLASGERRRVTLGMEFSPFALLSLRAGYLNNLGGATSLGAATDQPSGLGFGAGLKLGRYGLDYAVVPTAFDVTNKIALTTAF